jgi:hypothetical protein
LDVLIPLPTHQAHPSSKGRENQHSHHLPLASVNFGIRWFMRTLCGALELKETLQTWIGSLEHFPPFSDQIDGSFPHKMRMNHVITKFTEETPSVREKRDRRVLFSFFIFRRCSVIRKESTTFMNNHDQTQPDVMGTGASSYDTANDTFDSSLETSIMALSHKDLDHDQRGSKKTRAQGQWTWSGFCLWRKQRPFWGAILLVLAGSLVLWGPVSCFQFATLAGSTLWAGLLIGGLLFIMGLLQLFLPSNASMAGAVGIILSLVSLIVAAGGLGGGCASRLDRERSWSCLEAGEWYDQSYGILACLESVIAHAHRHGRYDIPGYACYSSFNLASSYSTRYYRML